MLIGCDMFSNVKSWKFGSIAKSSSTLNAAGAPDAALGASWPGSVARKLENHEGSIVSSFQGCICQSLIR